MRSGSVRRVSTDTFPRQNARTRRYTVGAPRSFVVAKAGDRVLFVRSGGGQGAVNSLWCLDASSGHERLVADPTVVLADNAGSAELTDAEKARRERARESGEGIVTYQATSDATKAVFALGGRLFVAEIGAPDEPTTITELPTPGNAFDPRFDPSGTKVAYVSGPTLRVTSADGDIELAAEPDAPTVLWGSAEFAAAEEMGRSRGFWWSPDGTTLLVARVDEAPIEQWHIAAPVDPGAPVRTIRYPQAGTANATVSLVLIGLDGSQTPVAWRTGETHEYLARAGWQANGRPWIAAQSRDQRTLDVIDIDPAAGDCSVVHTDSDESWVELMSGLPAWIDGKMLTTTIVDDTVGLMFDGQVVDAPKLQVRRVLRASADGVVVAGGYDATEIQLLRIGFDGSVEQLTTEPGIHGGVFSAGGSVRISSTLSAETSGASFHPLEGPPISIASAAETPVIVAKPHFHIVGARQLNIAVLLPDGDHDPESLPVLLDPYGGPHALRVQKSQASMRSSQWFADQGFAVVIADGRGTPGRGAAWERSVRNDLANPVLDDQVDALHAAAELYPQMDLTRVGIRGWSFGGYLAALAVMARPEVFHAGIAGAPVTEWRLYDTHYTERYLGNPSIDPGPYDTTSLVPLAPQLDRPLMLIHGLADDNVVAAHTLVLSRALLEAGRPHQVLPLSGVTHMTPQEEVAENLLLLQVAFLNDALSKGATTP